MKKIIAAALILCLIFVVGGCRKAPADQTQTADTSRAAETIDLELDEESEGTLTPDD